MAPKQAQKRTTAAAEISAPGAAKKQRKAPVAAVVDPVQERCDIVLAAVCGKESTLTASTKSMFTATAPFSLAVPLAERHSSQEAVVRMITDALTKMEEAIQSKVDEADEEARSKTGEKEGRATTTKEAEAVWNEKIDNENAKQASVEESKAALQAAADALKPAEVAQAEGDEDLNRAAGEKEALEVASRDHLAPLRDGCPEGTGAEEVQKHLDAMIPLCQRLGIEESLLHALPCVARKSPAERSSFDGLTFTEVENQLLQHAAALGQKLANGAAGIAERKAAVEAARTAVATAEATLKTSEEALEAAQTGREVSMDNFSNAQKAERSLAPAIRRADADKTKALKRLTDLRAGAITALTELRDGIPEPAAAEPSPAKSSPEEPAAADASVEDSVVAEPEKMVVDEAAVPIETAALGC